MLLISMGMAAGRSLEEHMSDIKYIIIKDLGKIQITVTVCIPVNSIYTVTALNM